MGVNLNLQYSACLASDSKREFSEYSLLLRTHSQYVFLHYSAQEKLKLAHVLVLSCWMRHVLPQKGKA